MRPEASRSSPAAAQARAAPAWLIVVPALLFAVPGTGAPSASEATPQRQVEARLMCYCGCTDLTVRVCTCGTADAIRRDIADRLARGETADQVVTAFVAQYGAQIRSAPTKEGFDLVAWITPFAAIILAGAALVAVVRRWGAARAASDRPPPGPSARDHDSRTGPSDPGALERVRRELKEDR